MFWERKRIVSTKVVKIVSTLSRISIPNIDGCLIWKRRILVSVYHTVRCWDLADAVQVNKCGKRMISVQRNDVLSIVCVHRRLVVVSIILAIRKKMIKGVDAKKTTTISDQKRKRHTCRMLSKQSSSLEMETHTHNFLHYTTGLPASMEMSTSS